MSAKGLMGLLGVAAIGALVATHIRNKGSLTQAPSSGEEDEVGPIVADERPRPIDPDTDIPLPGAGGGAGGPGSGSDGPPMVPFSDFIPPELWNIDLSGSEVWTYRGRDIFGEGQFPFHHWTVLNSLNDMPIEVYVREDSAFWFSETPVPKDWIAFFVKQDPPGSSPPSHAIIYKIADMSEKNVEWMLENIAKL